MSEVLLEVEGLNAYYSSAHVLHDVSFEVGRESVAIVGRNGMGKSTLCAALMGFNPPRSTGSVRFQGVELMGKPSHKIARRGLGYVPQGRRLFPSLSVDEHLKIAARNGKDGWNVDRVYELFPRLAERKRNGGAELSGGEQQMLAVARALMARPRLLMLDEPSLGLAPMIVREIFRIVRELNEKEGLTVLVVEQDARIALQSASSAYVLEVGKVAISGSSDELRENESVRRSYLGY
jgi:branched-chain amino acid transport system ATP-binding protein